MIAIIAILAAILFPVFAQAREKARQTSCLSNLRQISIGVLSYSEDADESYPLAQDANWNTWATEITPYIKSVQVFHCPDDPNGAVPAADAWAGPEISYVANGGFGWSPDAGANAFYGVFYPSADVGGFGQANTGLADSNSRSVASVTYPSSTIMVTERDTVFKDVCGKGNVGGLYFWGRSWVGSQWGEGAGGYDCDPNGYDFGPVLIPDGSRPAKTDPYDPNGPNGAVMAVHSGMANFAFVDGHVKAMKPAQTNPKSYQTGNAGNMWVSSRSQQ